MAGAGAGFPGGKRNFNLLLTPNKFPITLSILFNELTRTLGMGKDDFLDDFSTPSDNRRMTREEIIRQVTEPGKEPELSKNVVVIPATQSAASLPEMARELELAPGSGPYRILQIFCEEKRGTAVDARVLAGRIKGYSNEQFDLLETVCKGDGFSSKTILEVVLSIRRYSGERLLMLRSFVDLGPAEPGALNRFFMATLPQGSREKMGDEAYEQELQEKLMTLDQANLFYNLCTKVTGLTTGTALSALPKIRQLKAQHARIFNTFLRNDAVFGEQPIDDVRILGLINLWLTLPVFREERRFKKLMKQLNKKPDQKKKDFKFIANTFKTAVEEEEKQAAGGSGGGLKRFFR